MGLLDLLFPKYCVGCRSLGSYVCPNCFAKISLSQKIICLMCGRAALDGLTHPVCTTTQSIDGCFIGYEYSGVIKKLLFVFKYKPHVTDLRNTLQELFYEAVIQKEYLMHVVSKKTNLMIIPIPLHAKKLRTRGYNHAEFSLLP